MKDEEDAPSIHPSSFILHPSESTPMPSIRCKNCGLLVQVPAGGRRLCGCGAWLSGDEPVEIVEPVLEAVEAELADKPAAAWPRIEGDLSAIERLNDGYRRIRKEMSKAVVGQERVLEE